LAERAPEPRVVRHARADQPSRVANLLHGDLGGVARIRERLERAVGRAAAEDRRVEGPEPEQIRVAIVALDQNALHLPLALHDVLLPVATEAQRGLPRLLRRDLLCPRTHERAGARVARVALQRI